MKAFPCRNRHAPLGAACVVACMLSVAAATRPATAQAIKPSTRPATQPTTRAVQSALGQAAIRRDVARPEPTRASTPGTQPTTPGFDLPKVAGALALVLGLIFALRWLLKRSMNSAGLPGATNVLQVLTRTPLAPRQQVLLLRVGRRLLVVADCNGQLNSLSELSDPDEVAALVGQLRDEKLGAASGAFGNLLGRWRRATDTEDADAEQFPRVAPDVPERPADERGDDPSVESARTELSSLVERVRLLSNQFKRT